MSLLYHGSPSKRSVLQPGSMLTDEPTWAAGYATKIDMNVPTIKETFVGVIHVVQPNFENPFVNLGSLHQAEDKLIKLSKSTGGGLSRLAKKVHEEYGYDGIVARWQGKNVGAITLVDLPVIDYLDPEETVRQNKNNAFIPDNIMRILNPQPPSPSDWDI